MTIQVINPVDIIIFGGTGDLSYRKLLPALYRCEQEQQLSAQTRIFISSRSGTYSQEDFLKVIENKLQQFLSPSEWIIDIWQLFSQKLYFVNLDPQQADQRWVTFKDYFVNQQQSTLFYFAIPANVYVPTCEMLNQYQLINDHSRIILEKPIGDNLLSAQQIHSGVAQYFTEAQTYRIDHYLGKETVQNLLALRFSNALFEHLWDRNTIDYVQITLAEAVGLEGRVQFYDQAGAIRDMVQNHLLQLLCLIAMEPPQNLSAETIRAEKLKVLRSLRPIADHDIQTHTACGQYHSGFMRGQAVPGYNEDYQAATKTEQQPSTTETFVAIKTYIDNWRWGNVPFYLRTGKRLQQRFAEIVINYKPISHRIYDNSAGHLQPNRLIIRLQPEESIRLTLMTKELNSQQFLIKPIDLDINFLQDNTQQISDSYKRLLLDAIKGDPTLFIQRDEVEQAWQWLDPVIQAWQHQTPHAYAAGTMGPNQANTILEPHHHWFDPQ